jgi:hypothetical protein
MNAHCRSPRAWGALALVAPLALAACASSPTYHRVVMQGQVLGVSNDSLTVCIGSRDGAEVGQTLDVIRHVPQSPTPKQAAPGFRRERVGTVRIASIFDEHYAKAAVVDGHPAVNDVVELERR